MSSGRYSKKTLRYLRCELCGKRCRGRCGLSKHLRGPLHGLRGKESSLATAKAKALADGKDVGDLRPGKRRQRAVAPQQEEECHGTIVEIPVVLRVFVAGLHVDMVTIEKE